MKLILYDFDHKHLWSIIITWFFQIEKKNWQRCFSSEPSIEIVHFLFFFGIDSFLISISSHATFLKSLLYCSWFKCCVNFCSAAKWFSYTYIHILFHILFCYGLSQDIDYGSPSSTIGPFCFRVTSAKLYMSFSKRYLLKFSNFLAYNYVWFSVILRFPFYCCCYPLLLTTGFGQDPNRK